MGWYDRKVRRVRDLSCGDTRIYLELEVRRLDCRNCGKVKREPRDFLSDNPLYTKRFAYFVGRRCRQASIADVAKELALDWHTVKALEMQYMEVQLARVGRPGPQVIGIDEIAIRKGTRTGSWSAICCAAGRSGLAATTARKRAWRGSTPGWVRARERASGLR
jgi:transposase